MTDDTLPVVLSCGEPAGIGPEVAARAWAAICGDIPVLWLGDPRHLPRDIPHQVIERADQARAVCRDALPVLASDFGSDAIYGQPQPGHAQRVIDMIAKGVAMVRAGQASALCTAPIHKKALMDGAGFAYPGHTEYLAALGGVEDVVMMLASDQLRVVPATIHIALEQVPLALTPQKLRRTIEITAQELQSRFGVERPRIAVAGLNPHAGEGGSMGQQEIDWIAPLIIEMQGEGYALAGPLPADTMFHARARAGYDAAVAMYHDRGVNVTLGLPCVRTSPDHGTAFDIAGQGRANPTSMIEAIKLAWQMGQKT